MAMMTRKPPRRCAEDGKVAYDFKFDAETAARERSKYAGIPLTVYRCEFSGYWHITKCFGFG